MAEERVQKILARAGYGSRRASEELITAGRVRINGEVAVLGSKADPSKDTITIDNQSIAKAQAPIYVAVNKPTGILSEVSPDEPRQTVRDLVPLPGHMFIVGRLDMDSEGLILMTNDGEMANRLSHPRYGHEKEYRVLVGTRPDERQMEAWRHGVVLEDGTRTAPAEVRLEGLAGSGSWLRVILREGRKRQIREMGKQTGVPVLRIQRIRIGSLLLGELKLGQWRELRPEEIRELKINKPARQPAPRTGRAGRPAGSAGAARGGPVRNGPSARHPGDHRPGDRRSGPPRAANRAGATDRTGDRRSGPPRAADSAGDTDRPATRGGSAARYSGDRPAGDRHPGDRRPGPARPFNRSSGPRASDRPDSSDQPSGDAGSHDRSSSPRPRIRRPAGGPGRSGSTRRGPTAGRSGSPRRSTPKRGSRGNTSRSH